MKLTVIGIDRSMKEMLIVRLIDLILVIMYKITNELK